MLHIAIGYLPVWGWALLLQGNKQCAALITGFIETLSNAIDVETILEHSKG
jgi:hypothetical protein